jgi:polyphosphate kinase 2 (PPK2 family)
MIKIFNRSHYEDVLVPVVEKFITKDALKKRYEDINNFEQLLINNGTTVLKFYLNISHEKQKEKLLDRLENPEKYWKHNDGDRESREKWDLYMDQYHDVFKNTDTGNAPWHVIAADQNWRKAYQVAKIVVAAFEKMNPHWPKLEADVAKYLEEEDDD